MSLGAGKRPPETKKATTKTRFLSENCLTSLKLSAVESPLQNQVPAQRFPRQGIEWSTSRDIAKFLDNAPDVEACAKLPQRFEFSIKSTDGGMNLRSYYPDFVAVDDKGVRWLLEAKGAETDDVPHKDAAAMQWCENATQLTKMQWQ